MISRRLGVGLAGAATYAAASAATTAQYGTERRSQRPGFVRKCRSGGKHLATENIRGQLVARGIQPNSARKAAMFQLAGEIPTPILAEILDLSAQTAVRWAALAARDWSQYTAIRGAHLAPSDTIPRWESTL